MNGVVIVAAGSGSRMKMGINKQFIKLNDKEIIAYTIDKFYNHDEINDIVIVIKKEEIEFFTTEIINKYNYKNIKIAYGGLQRQDSVYNGIKLLNEDCDLILVHDGARPFITNDIISNSIEEAKKNSAVVVGVPVKDTIKIINENNEIIDTPNRSQLWAVQTPQTFKYDVLKKAYEDAFECDFYGTDDAMLVERIGYKVKMIEGSYNNIKITTREDLSVGSQILKEENQ